MKNVSELWWKEEYSKLWSWHKKIEYFLRKKNDWVYKSDIVQFLISQEPYIEEEYLESNLKQGLCYLKSNIEIVKSFQKPQLKIYKWTERV